MQFQISKNIADAFLMFFLITSPGLVLDHGPGSRPGPRPKLVPVFGSGPWSQSLVPVLGPSPWSRSLVPVLGSGPWSRSLVLVLGLSPWSQSLVLVLGPGPWSRSLVPVLGPGLVIFLLPALVLSYLWSLALVPVPVLVKKIGPVTQ